MLQRISATYMRLDQQGRGAIDPGPFEPAISNGQRGHSLHPSTTPGAVAGSVLLLLMLTQMGRSGTARLLFHEAGRELMPN
jgi:hypothetical protein